MTINETLLRLPAVLQLSGVGRSTHYKFVGTGLFTRPVSISPRLKAWPAGEVHAINQARVAGKSDDDIKRLVKRLETKRTAQCAEVAA